MEPKTIATIGIIFLVLVIGGALVLSSFGIATVGKFTAADDISSQGWFEDISSDQTNDISSRADWSSTGPEVTEVSIDGSDGGDYPPGAIVEILVTVEGDYRSGPTTGLKLVRSSDEDDSDCFGMTHTLKIVKDQTAISPKDVFFNVPVPAVGGTYWYHACIGVTYKGRSTWLRSTGPVPQSGDDTSGYDITGDDISGYDIS